MPGSVAGLFSDTQSGSRLLHGGDLNRIITLTASAKSGIVALAGGGQINATQLGAYINEITVCATANDSAQLQPALAGMEVTVVNSGATNLRLYAFPKNPNNQIQGAPQDDAIVPLAGGAPVSFVTIAPGGYANFLAMSLGRWKSQNV